MSVRNHILVVAIVCTLGEAERPLTIREIAKRIGVTKACARSGLSSALRGDGHIMRVGNAWMVRP